MKRAVELRVVVARGESPSPITGTQQSLAGLCAGMRWSRDVRRDTQRLRPVTRSLAIIRCDIVPAHRSPSEDRTPVSQRGYTRKYRQRCRALPDRKYTLNHRTLYWILRGMQSRAYLPGCISDLERVGCTVQCRLPLHPTYDTMPLCYN